MTQTDRLRKWDELIRQKRYPGIQNYNELVQSGSPIAERTLEKDINKLKALVRNKYPDEKQPVRFSRQKGGYYYAGEYAAFNDFDRKDMRTLVDICRSLQGYEHLFSGNEGQNILYKLKALAKEKNLENDTNSIHWRPVVLNKEGRMEGQEHFDDLVTCIEQLQSIDLHYLPFERKSYTSYRVLPVLLKEWQNCWSMLAYPLKDWDGKSKIHLRVNGLKVFGLNRVVRVLQQGQHFRDQIANLNNFNPHKYFEHAFGIFRTNLDAPPTVYQLKLETSDLWMYGYLKKTPIHPTFNIVEDEPSRNYMRFTVDLEWSPELTGFLLQFSPRLKLLGNKEVLSKFKSCISSISNLYDL